MFDLPTIPAGRVAIAIYHTQGTTLKQQKKKIGVKTTQTKIIEVQKTNGVHACLQYLIQCMDHSLLIIYVGSEGIERFSEKEVPDRECHAVDGRPEGSQGHEEPIHIIGVAKQPEE